MTNYESATSAWYFLNWGTAPLSYPGLVGSDVAGDGSCFFHVIVRSSHPPYLGYDASSRGTFVRRLRQDLAIQLPKERFPGVSWYQSLSRGTFETFAEGVPEYSLEHLCRQLDSNDPVDNVYNEYLSEILDRDLYLVDALTGDVYVTGDDDEILYKGRPSIVILVRPGHYELIGVLEEQEKIKTLFEPSHPFIEKLRDRLKEKRGKQQV